MLQVSKNTLEDHNVQICTVDFPRECSNCNGTIEKRKYKCDRCNTGNFIRICCPNCHGEISFDRIVYEVKRTNDIYICKECGVDKCTKCKCIFLSDNKIESMERLADCAPSGFRILDETGILCDQFIEIWAGSSETPNSDREFEYEEGDTKLYFGPQSELFVQSVHLITDYDESDWGHDQEWTIKIFPGEPYDLVQRRSIYRMLARLRQETEGNISFWTRYLHTIGESEASDVISELLEAILSSSIDIDGTLLALAYKSVNDSHPGELTDTFRLLELIVKRILESLIRVRRPDQRLSDEEFVKLIRVVTSNDLAAKIGFVLENAQVEHEVLENVWNSIERKRGFNAGDLAPSIVRFRNRIAHGDTQAEDLQNLVLPWEMPNYGIVLFNMRRFLTAIIRNDYY